VQRVDYSYDFNPYDYQYSQNAWGRLTAVTFNVAPQIYANRLAMNYQYSYNNRRPRHGPALCDLGIPGKLDTSTPVNLDASYGWDTEEE